MLNGSDNNIPLSDSQKINNVLEILGDVEDLTEREREIMGILKGAGGN